MPEYIDREATLNALRKAHNPNTARMAISFSAVNSVPAADVRPVVLCKDCMNSTPWYRGKLLCYFWNEDDGHDVFQDGFCSYGKLRNTETAKEGQV